MSADWSRVDAVIEAHSEKWRTDAARMVDEALVAVGIPRQTVNRRRGQLNRHARRRAQQGAT